MTVRLIKLAVIYLVVGMTLGIFMGISGDFHLRGVHAHVNLLGWASIGLAALVFHVFPQLAGTRLATIWFWTYNVSLPIALGSLALMLSGYAWAAPGVKVGHIVVWASGVLFAVNVLWTLRTRREPAAIPVQA
jgi:cbb3-type cytochrome oxidase subunit 1